MQRATSDGSAVRIVLHDELASGGTATVHLACLVDEADGARTVVAVKRLKDGASDPELLTMLFDEARCAKRIRHPNVVPILDVVADPSGVMLVLEYVHGETLAQLFGACLAARGRIPTEIAVAIVVSVLEGLEAAHNATDADGTPLHIVHRDVSPQNVMLGDDGVPRLLDFGIAKAVGRLRTTRDGTVRGKIGYLAPEQLVGKTTRQSDVFSAAVVLWELLVGRRLYRVQDPRAFLEALSAPPRAPSSAVADLPPELDRAVLRGLARDPGARYATAKEMARDLAASVPLADRAALAAFVAEHASVELERRRSLVAAIALGRGAPATRAAGGSAIDATDRLEATHRLAAADANGGDDPNAAPPAAPMPAPSARSLYGALGAGAVVVLLVVLVLVFGFRARTAGRPPAPALAAAGVDAPTASADSPSPPPSIATPAESVPAPPREERRADPRARTPPAKRVQRPSPDCDPPYTLSEDGARRIPKRECFQ